MLVVATTQGALGINRSIKARSALRFCELRYARITGIFNFSNGRVIAAGTVFSVMIPLTGVERCCRVWRRGVELFRRRENECIRRRVAQCSLYGRLFVVPGRQSRFGMYARHAHEVRVRMDLGNRLIAAARTATTECLNKRPPIRITSTSR